MYKPLNVEKRHVIDIETAPEKNVSAHQNLPPGFNPNVSTVTVQNATLTSHQTTNMGTGPALQGQPQGHAFYGPPGSGLYAGHSGSLPYTRAATLHAKNESVNQQSINESREKIEVPDASELAMLGIDASDFKEFGQ